MKATNLCLVALILGACASSELIPGQDTSGQSDTTRRDSTSADLGGSDNVESDLTSQDQSGVDLSEEDLENGSDLTMGDDSTDHEVQLPGDDASEDQTPFPDDLGGAEDLATGEDLSRVADVAADTQPDFGAFDFGFQWDDASDLGFADLGGEICNIPGGGLFISEVADYTDISGRYVELFNGGNVSVDLSDYTLKRYSSSGNFLALDPISDDLVPPCGVYVIAFDGASFADIFGSEADLALTGQAAQAVNSNGDDAFILENVAGPVDIYGVTSEAGTTPNKDWFFADNSAQRNPAASAPNNTFSTSDWIITNNFRPSFFP
ncbi:MAG: lamin tail domain-containing protein [Myxococcales bacterium]|nr:lamin tail domain-containing protein [Myxococcales bacterium]